MLNSPWWFYSILAAIMWGIHFNLVVKVSSILPRDIYTPLTLFVFTSSITIVILIFSPHRILENIQTIFFAEPSIKFSAILLIFTTIIAASLLYIAMQLSGNATLASLIDITYPLFVALFAWLIFRENHLDWSVVVGGILIFAGSMLIIWKHGS